MKKQISDYNTMLPEFKRNATVLLANHLPGNLRAAQALVNASLKNQHPTLKRWHNGLKDGLITVDAFIRLYKSLKDVFILNDLSRRGVSKATSNALREMVSKLFRAMMIISSGAVNIEFNNDKPNSKL